MESRLTFGHRPVEVPYRGTDTRDTQSDSRARRKLDAVMQGMNAGASGVEADVRPLHTGKTPIHGYDARLNDELVSLKQLFETLPPDKHVYLEVKNQKVFFSSKRKHFEKKLVQFIQENNLHERVTLVGFALVSLWRIKRMDPRIDVEAGVTHPPFQNVTPEIIERAHRRGVTVEPWVCEQTREEEKTLLQKFLTWGVDAVYTNAPDVAKDLQRKEKPTGQNPKFGASLPVSGAPKFGGTIGRSDMQNIFPDWWIRRKKRPKEPEQFFTAAQERYGKLKEAMQARGLSAKTIEEVSAFTNQVLGLPPELPLDMPREKFLADFKTRPAAGQDKILYSLQRYPMFMVDHFASLFDAVKTDEDWRQVNWILQGLMGHPDNANLTLTSQPIGLITKTLAQQLESQSPLWSAVTQVTRYYDDVLRDAFLSGTPQRIEQAPDGKFYAQGDADSDAAQAAYKLEKDRFVQETLYEWMRDLNPPQGENTALAEFVGMQLPVILNRFRENYPPPKVVSEEGGHPDYFRQLQANLLNNVMLLLMHTERMGRSAFLPQAPHGPKEMRVINHTPYNHLRRGEEGGDA